MPVNTTINKMMAVKKRCVLSICGDSGSRHCQAEEILRGLLKAWRQTM
jgi:hypothetical protein